MLHAKFSKKIEGLKTTLQSNSFLSKFLPLVLGLLALGWFLIRVIPKPQRASYPCMQAAYPLMTGIVIWLIGITGIAGSAKLIMNSIRSKKYILTAASLFLFASLYLVLSYSDSDTLLATNDEAKLPVHLSNEPFGKAQGIVPGRVVWAWDPAATNENCTNDTKNNDGYHLEKNNNQQVIDKMFDKSILSVSDSKSEKKAWDAIFKQFNKQKGKGNVGYKANETIYIKVNLGMGKSTTNPDLTRKTNAIAYSETSPQVMLSVLKQLVNVAGVPQSQIYVGDPNSHMYQDVFEYLHKEFPKVNYAEKDADKLTLGRTLITADTIPVIVYSDKGTVHGKKTPDECLYKEMENADYMINIAALKAHGCAGISICAKNHFGSITRPNAYHLHASHVSRGNDRPVRVDYKMYRVFVDLMGSKYLGRNTMLFVVDALWSGPEAVASPIKWTTAPFNNDWPNSLLVSLDPVAIESVGFDFLRYEASVGSAEWHNRPNFAQGVDDYLHQAASSEYWPEGIVYDPDNSGKPIPSLGVHEHWNNPIDRQYSRNLGKPDGIELVKIMPN
jgi:hypothetical protein